MTIRAPNIKQQKLESKDNPWIEAIYSRWPRTPSWHRQVRAGLCSNNNLFSQGSANVRLFQYHLNQSGGRLTPIKFTAYFLSSHFLPHVMQPVPEEISRGVGALDLLCLDDKSNPDQEAKGSDIIVDARGDLILRIGLSDDGYSAQRFRVCSRTLARASPVLERMLYGSFAESECSEEWTVDLPEVNPNPFIILAYISHGQLWKIPKSLTAIELFDLLVLTHYYDCTPILAPWADRWLAMLPEPASHNELGMYKVMFIFQELGEKRKFEITARRLVLECPRSPSHDDFHDQLGGHLCHIVDRIDEIREDTIQAMLTLFRDLSDILVVVDEKPRWCRFASYMGPHRCESMILGSVVFCLTRANLWPIPASQDMNDSVMGLYRQLTSIVIHDIGQPEKKGNDHSNCNPRGFLLERLQRILADMADPLVEGEREYVKMQRQRLGYFKDDRD